MFCQVEFNSVLELSAQPHGNSELHKLSSSKATELNCETHAFYLHPRVLACF